MPVDNNISFTVQPPQNTRCNSFVNSASYVAGEALSNAKKMIQRRVSFHVSNMPVIKDETRLKARRHSSGVPKTFKQLNQ